MIVKIACKLYFSFYDEAHSIGQELYNDIMGVENKEMEKENK